jgi:hypothetical protein
LIDLNFRLIFIKQLLEILVFTRISRMFTRISPIWMLTLLTYEIRTVNIQIGEIRVNIREIRVKIITSLIYKANLNRNYHNKITNQVL